MGTCAERRSVDRVINDWFSLLNHGHIVTATGNSDTHHLTYNLGVSLVISTVAFAAALALAFATWFASVWSNGPGSLPSCMSGNTASIFLITLRPFPITMS